MSDNPKYVDIYRLNAFVNPFVSEDGTCCQNPEALEPIKKREVATLLHHLLVLLDERYAYAINGQLDRKVRGQKENEHQDI